MHTQQRRWEAKDGRQLYVWLDPLHGTDSALLSFVCRQNFTRQMVKRVKGELELERLSDAELEELLRDG